MKDFPLKVRQLSVNYGSTPALWDISFEIPEGKLVAVVGPNGAGKSTLLKATLGLIKPIAGSVLFYGMPLKKGRRRIAYIPQKESVDWDFPMTVYDLVLMGRYGRLNLFRLPNKEDKKMAWKYLSDVGLDGVADRQISELSGGQQQRAFLARALAQEADLYLMDEPFSGVDVSSKAIIIPLLENLKIQGKTIVVVHHDLESVPHLFDMAILLNMHLVAVGNVSEIFNTEMIKKTFGKDNFLFQEAMKRNERKQGGFVL